MHPVNDPTHPERARFEKTALPFIQSLYGTAWRLTRNREDASDLVQETYLRAYRTFSGFTPGTNCKAWLFTILYSVFTNRYRKKRREPEALSIEELEARYGDVPRAEGWGSHRSVLENPDLGWAAPEIDRALGLLPPDFRAAVLLVDVEELTYEEASQALGCPVGTVRSRLYRARKLLFETLVEYAGKRGYGRRK